MDYNQVVIKKGLERDKDYDVMAFGKRAGLVEVCFSEPVVSERRLAELFLEVKDFLDREGISFYMLAIILQDSDTEKGEKIGAVSDILSYEDIDENVYSKVLSSDKLRKIIRED